jgi:DNA-directed RNA polymerase subunit K/omega
MNDFEKAAKNIGNRFEMVLVASERMREIHRQRRSKEDLGDLDHSLRKTTVPPCIQTISDIENGVVGREYLKRISSRTKKKTVKFTEI